MPTGGRCASSLHLACTREGKMSVGPVWGFSVVFLLLNAAAEGQTAPGLVSHPSGPESFNRFIFPPPSSGSTHSPSDPVSQNYDVIQTRSKMGKTFWFGWGVAAALSVASAEMTVHCEHVAGCSETNPLFGNRPTRLELYAPRAAVITAGILLCRHWKRRDPNDKTATIGVVGIDALWGADTAWDVHELSAIPRGTPRTTRTP